MTLSFVRNKGFMIKEYFADYYIQKSNYTVNLTYNEIDYHVSKAEPLKITLVDTRIDPMTEGRIKRIKKRIDNQPFFLTYGNGIWVNGGFMVSMLDEFIKWKKFSLPRLSEEGKLSCDKPDDF